MYDSWLTNPEFIELAKSGIDTPIIRNGIFRLRKKLKKVKVLAKAWSKELGNSSKHMEDAKSALDKEALTQVSYPHSKEVQLRVRNLQANLLTKLSMEDSGLKQRSKVNWLKLGDSSTMFFSLATKIRRARNSTLKILTREENNIMTRGQMEKDNIDR